MQNFTAEELKEIKKWAEVIAYRGTAQDLSRALELNREIVFKCSEGLAEGKGEKNYMEDRAEVDG